MLSREVRAEDVILEFGAWAARSVAEATTELIVLPRCGSHPLYQHHDRHDKLPFTMSNPSRSSGLSADLLIAHSPALILFAFSYLQLPIVLLSGQIIG